MPKIHHISDEALKYLKSHDLAILSTVDRTGNVSGSVVHYLVDQDNFIYILTRSGTTKGRNIYAHSQVALTIYEVETQETIQLQGIAENETNQQKKSAVFSQMTKSRSYGGKMLPPPVTKLQEGIFTVIRISPESVKYNNYSKTK